VRERGRPFAHGDDPRRNLKGRKAPAKRTPSQIVLDTLLARQVVTRSGKRRVMTKLEVALEQQMAQAMQGNEKAIRALATLMRATRDMAASPAPGDPEKAQVHNIKKLNSLLEEYGEKYADAVRNGRAGKIPSQEGDDEQ